MSGRTKVREWAWATYVYPKGRLGNRLQGAVIGGLETRRVRRAWQGAERILLVHTQGKVGSKAIVAAVEDPESTDVVLHTHRLNQEATQAADAQHWGMAPRRTWFTARVVAEALAEPGEKEIVVLSAVRDPVLRGLSSYFQNLERFTDDGRPVHPRGVADAEELGRRFVERFDLTLTLHWMELEVNDVFGIDIYAEPFDHQRGYQVFRRDHLTVGILRHDRFRDTLGDFVEEVTGRPARSVGRVNDSQDKAYAEAYATLASSLRIPEPIVTTIYESRFAHHFFTQQEREAAVARWLGDSSQ